MLCLPDVSRWLEWNLSGCSRRQGGSSTLDFPLWVGAGWAWSGKTQSTEEPIVGAFGKYKNAFGKMSKGELRFKTPLTSCG